MANAVWLKKNHLIGIDAEVYILYDNTFKIQMKKNLTWGIVFSFISFSFY